MEASAAEPATIAEPGTQSEVNGPAPIDLRRDVAASWKRLLPYQRQGVAFGVAAQGRFLLADEMGLGKSAQAILLAAQFADEWPLLVVCPASMRYIWAAELERWLPTGLAPALVHLCEGRSFDVPASAAVTIATYSLFEGPTRVATSVAALEFKVIITDESHYLRSAKSKRTMILAPIFQQAKRLILLSGTPALARPVELYAQLAALAPREFGNYHAYTERYCDAHRDCFGWNVKGASNIEELHSRLAPMMLRRRKADVLTQLPPKRRQLVRIDIASQHRAEMRRLMSDLATMRASAEELAGCTTERMERREGFERRRALMETYKKTGEAKAEMAGAYIVDLLQGSDERHKVLVFAYHRSVLDVLTTAVARVSCEHIRIDGDTSPAERSRLVTLFQESPTHRVAILSVTAAGQGLTLTAASTVVFAELHWTPGVLQQAEDRAHRVGQHNAVQVIYLVCFDTEEALDRGLWGALTKKMEVVGRTLDGRGAEWKADDKQDQIGASSGDDAEDLRLFFADVAERAAKRCSSAEQGFEGTQGKAPRGDIRSLLRRKDRAVVISESDGEGQENVPRFPNTALDTQGQDQGKGNTDELSALTGPFTNKLKFSVSPHTGRAALHDSTTGSPLGIVFDPAARGLAETSRLDVQVANFVREWRRLRPPERRELCGRLLWLPLSEPLAAARCARSGGSGDARQQCFERKAPAKSANTDTCGWCKKQLDISTAPQDPAAQHPTPGYCSRQCWVEDKIRGAFQSRAIRHELFSVEHGICQLCRLDAHALYERVRALTPPERYQVLLASRFVPKGAVLDDPKEEHFWQADHILAVAEGGGQCSLANFRTLCTPCHLTETARLRDRLSAHRRSATAAGTRSLHELFKKASKDKLLPKADDMQHLSVDSQHPGVLDNSDSLSLETSPHVLSSQCGEVEQDSLTSDVVDISGDAGNSCAEEESKSQSLAVDCSEGSPCPAREPGKACKRQAAESVDEVAAKRTKHETSPAEILLPTQQ